MKSIFKKYPALFISILLTLAVPVILYWANFDKLSFSKPNFSGWQGFSAFYGLYVSIANVIITIILTVRIINISEANNNIQKNIQKPVISFVKVEEFHYYIIKNVGNGPAVNITLYKRITQDDNLYNKAFDDHKLFYSLGPNDNIDGGVFTRQSNLLAALYKDVFGDEHFSLMSNGTLYYGKVDELYMLREEIQKELKEKYQWIIRNPNPSPLIQKQ